MIHKLTRMTDIGTPFNIFSIENSMALGYLLLSLSIALLIMNAMNAQTHLSNTARTTVGTVLAISVFFGVRITPFARQAYMFLAVLLVVAIPALVGFVAFRKIILTSIANQ